jgi:hypothetical protein
MGLASLIEKAVNSALLQTATLADGENALDVSLAAFAIAAE